MLIFFHLDRFAKKAPWSKLVSDLGLSYFILAFKMQREKCPRTVEADISCELLAVFVSGNCGSMYTNNIADTLANWQVIKLVSEEDDGYEVGNALVVHP